MEVFEARCGCCSRGKLTQLWPHLRSTMGKTQDLVLFCLHMTNTHSREGLQSFYVSCLTCANTQMQKTCLKKCLKPARKLKRDGVSLTQRPVKGLNDSCLFFRFCQIFNVSSPVDRLLCILRNTPLHRASKCFCFCCRTLKVNIFSFDSVPDFLFCFFCLC